MAITQKFEKALFQASQTLEKQKEQGKNYFNIFDALGVSYKENYHSAFIAYLLDKNSEHYQRIFAEQFLIKLKKEIPSLNFGSLNTENLLSIQTEASTEKSKQNRRMDILMTFVNDIHIIIENKIGAKDQSAQIKSYVEEIYKRKNKLSDKQKYQTTLVIYLHPDEIDPSEMSFGKTSTRIKKHWYLDKDGRYPVIRDENDQIKAYYFQMTYKWIKSWVESCVKELEKQAKTKVRGDLKTRGENGLNKIIFGLNQYIEILEWYITDEWVENDPVAKFIMQDNKNQKMALEIMKDEKHDLHKVLKNSWDKISENIVENFYKKLLEKFDTKKVKINDEIWLCERLDENRVYYEQFRFYPQKYEGYTNFTKLFLYYDGSHFKDIGLGLCLCQKGNISAKEHEKLEKIFQKNNEKNGIKKYHNSFLSTRIFDDKPIENFAQWLIEKGDTDKQIEIFIKKIDEYIKNNSLIKNTLTKLDNLKKI